MKPVHMTPNYFLMVHSNNIVQSTSVSFKLSLTVTFCDKKAYLIRKFFNARSSYLSRNRRVHTVTSCSTANSQVQPIVPDTSRVLTSWWSSTVPLCRRETLQTVVAICQSSGQQSEWSVQTDIFRYNMYPEGGGTVFLRNVVKLLSDYVTWRPVRQ